METFIKIIKETPLWVWLLLVYILIIGIKASRTQVISLIKLLILPFIFIVMGIYNIFANFIESPAALWTWIGAVIIGSIASWLIWHNMTIKADKKHHLIEVPGTWSTLILILVVFSIKYYFGYAVAENPNVLKNIVFSSILLSISGLITGVFIGKVIRYFQKFNSTPHTNLTPNR